MDPAVRPTVVRVRGFTSLERDIAEAVLRRFIDERSSASSQETSYELSFVPACDNENEEVALVDFRHGLPEFLLQLRQNPLDSWQVFVEELNDYLSFDQHFMGFTQLYDQLPSQSIIADIITITGIDGHAYGSWQNKGLTRRMWLRHFLGTDLPSCRTMIYGYDSKLAKRGFEKIEDYARGLLEDLKEIRHGEAQQRPLIFVAHSFGGIILARCLIKAMQTNNSDHPALATLHRATYGLIFFAVPQHGLDVEDMSQIMGQEEHPRTGLLHQISTDSKELHHQLTDFKDILYDRKVISFYETEQSRRLQRNDRGEWTRSGDYFTSLDSDHALLQLPKQTETPIPLPSDHSNIVKFVDRYEAGYRHTLSHLKTFLQNAPEVVRSRFSSSHPVAQQYHTFISGRNKNNKPLSRDEERCLQLFRLQNEENQSYEWYKGRVTERIEGTCRWFLEDDKYRRWREQDSGPLLVSADPGCGKSVLAKYLVDHELPRSSLICYFFFNDQVQSTLKLAFCALLHQLFSEKPFLLHRYALPEEAKNGPKLVDNITVLWSILCEAARDPETGPVIFVLDALDECHKSEYQDLILMLKSDLHKQKDKPEMTKYLLTSRPYELIMSDFEELIDRFPHIRITGEEESERISQEVNYVIEYRVRLLAREKKLAENIKSHLERRLLEVPHRTYLWVHLVFDYLKEGFKKTEKAVDTIISTLPESVNAAYEKILSKSKENNKVQKTLSIILAATRPLTLKEMNIAINVDPSIRSTSKGDLDIESDEDFKITLRNWCGLFISVYNNQVHFLHQTAREFLVPKQALLSSSPSRALKWCGSIDLQLAHSILADVCMIYLKFRDLEDYVLLDYSAKNWAVHLRHAGIEDQEYSISAIRSLCDPSTERFHNWFEIYWNANHYKFDKPPNRTELMIISYFGFCEAVALLLEEGAEPNVQHDTHGKTALHWPAYNGHEAVVRLLPDNGAEVNIQDEGGMTALCWAAVRGHTVVVKQLLDKGANVNIADDHGQTALHLATAHGVVKQLLDKGADVDIKNDRGETALYLAVLDSDNTVIEQLLDKGADVNTASVDGYTVLGWALADGDDTLVEQLLAKGAYIQDEGHDEEYMNMLFLNAAYGGHEIVVEQTLGKGVNINMRNHDYGMTALSGAASEGHKTVVKLLLDKGSDIDMRDGDYDSGWTALLHASSQGHKTIVELLLDKGADINIYAYDGWTALGWAAYKGHTAIVELLLDKGVDINMHDDGGMTALSCAANRGRETAVKLLLDIGADINKRDDDGRTALIYAVSEGDRTVIKLLLDEGADINIADKYNDEWTALDWALNNEDEEIAELL